MATDQEIRERVTEFLLGLMETGGHSDFGLQAAELLTRWVPAQYPAAMNSQQSGLVVSQAQAPVFTQEDVNLLRQGLVIVGGASDKQFVDSLAARIEALL